MQLGYLQADNCTVTMDARGSWRQSGRLRTGSRKEQGAQNCSDWLAQVACKLAYVRSCAGIKAVIAAALVRVGWSGEVHV